MTPKLILASASPRRQELLHSAGVSFEVHAANISEICNPGEPPLDYALRLARDKATAVAAKFPGRFVLGADTIVVVDNQLLEKPKDAEDAERMLRLLSDRSHKVSTAVALVLPTGKIDRGCATTQVFFRHITPEEIRAYVATGEPMDKAGAYAIQGGAGHWNTRLEGDYTNVVGLPLPLVMDMLRAGRFL